VQLITICAIVKSKCAIEKGNVCTKSADFLVKIVIYAPISRFCTVYILLKICSVKKYKKNERIRQTNERFEFVWTIYMYM